MFRGVAGKTVNDWNVFIPLWTPAAYEEADEGDADMDAGDHVGSPAGPAGTPVQPGKASHKPLRIGRKKHRALANKPQDFQVLYRIVN